ncbi:MAG TPA: hypothetical protein VJI97_00935 [Candidatus Nanoarchaeia archaeon]|nr:hypothetical protein [Candidatus Nanoarchaeia archaeon]
MVRINFSRVSLNRTHSKAISAKKGQISVEYMMIIGFATMMALPLLIIYYNYSSDATEAVASGQAMQIARLIADSSESVYFLGSPSQTTLKLNFPDNIESTNLSNREVLFRMELREGRTTDIVQISSVNMSGTLPKTAGMHTVTILAQDGYVLVTSN